RPGAGLSDRLRRRTTGRRLDAVAADPRREPVLLEFQLQGAGRRGRALPLRCLEQFLLLLHGVQLGPGLEEIVLARLEELAYQAQGEQLLARSHCLPRGVVDALDDACHRGGDKTVAMA